MATRTAKEWVALEQATAANLNKAAGGWIGTTANSSDQTGISSETTLTDLSVTVTAGTSRQLLILAQGVVSAVTNTAAFVGRIEKDGTNGGTWALESDPITAGTGRLCTGFYYDQPSAGSHSYSMDLARSSGTGTLTVNGTSPSQARLIVLDVGSVA